MVERKLVSGISRDFAFLRGKVLGILLFGSHVYGGESVRSDVDVCIVAPETNSKELFDMILATRLPERYDIKIFEALPLKMKGTILDDHVIVWSSDLGELTYYLHRWVRIWGDQKMALRRVGVEVFS